MSKTQTIALAGVGNCGRYICEQLSSDERYHVVVLTRDECKPFNHPNVTTHVTDYSEESVLSILSATGSSTLISLVRCPEERYLSLHQGFLNACIRSAKCKRFIPSEWAGNIEDFPDLPGEYSKTRAPFRTILQQSRGIEWTLFCHGWFMEYFIPENKSYMTHIPGEFPIDLKSWSYCVRGTGEEPQTWTCGRDVARAVAELLAAPQWEPVTYIVGERGTFNKAAKQMEEFYGRPFSLTYRSVNDIKASLEQHRNDGDSLQLGLAEAEEWTISGATACPEDKTRRQHAKYFSEIKFSNLEELLIQAETVDKI
ncbi:hypothetical protein N7463_000296 [Penicillium fimorum]|uniref:NmrA-like domain-containing protein n=1 Tax=Penicillium fimorum TaxID=1882269 RepID=A0A9W9Y4V9_9EURO|nr:hypothetical protein N7463_000296 [Penicillium fimorum]